MEAATVTSGPAARIDGLAGELMVVRAMVRRSLNEILRVPGAAIPGVLAPTIFLLGLTSVFGNLAELPGFDADNYISFLLPVSLMQAAAFTGAATGVNLARDIEQGWFDRILLAPRRRLTLLAGIVLSASMRVLLPVTLILAVGLSLGASWPGFVGLLVALGVVMSMAAIASCWGTTLALRFRSQSVAPLMQAAMFMAVLFTTSYAPQDLLVGWLAEVARVNPVTQALEAVRQGFIGPVTWRETWQGLAVVIGLALLLGAAALRGMRRATA